VDVHTYTCTDTQPSAQHAPNAQRPTHTRTQPSAQHAHTPHLAVFRDGPVGLGHGQHTSGEAVLVLGVQPAKVGSDGAGASRLPRGGDRTPRRHAHTHIRVQVTTEVGKGRGQRRDGMSESHTPFRVWHGPGTVALAGCGQQHSGGLRHGGPRSDTCRSPHLPTPLHPTPPTACPCPSPHHTAVGASGHHTHPN
jgi:hypothetical protein